MNSNQYQTVKETELSDFQTACEQRGMQPTEFKLTEHSIIETPDGQGMFRSNAKLTVTRISNQKSAEYDTGNGTRWVANFARDLINRVFN